MTRAPCRNHMASYGVDVSIVSNFRTVPADVKRRRKLACAIRRSVFAMWAIEANLCGLLQPYRNCLFFM